MVVDRLLKDSPNIKSTKIFEFGILIDRLPIISKQNLSMDE